MLSFEIFKNFRLQVSGFYCTDKLFVVGIVDAVVVKVCDNNVYYYNTNIMHIEVV
jgi:hypothetical protein